MKVSQIIGGFEYAATVGAHEGSDNSPNYIRVEGPGLSSPAEYLRDLGDRDRVGSEEEGLDAIRYTVDNLVFPLALADALRLRNASAIAGEAQRGETVEQGSTGTASTRAGTASPQTQSNGPVIK